MIRSFNEPAPVFQASELVLACLSSPVWKRLSDHALEDARASEARWSSGQPKGLLDGVPVSIKDIILTKGWKSRPIPITNRSIPPLRKS